MRQTILIAVLVTLSAGIASAQRANSGPPVGQPATGNDSVQRPNSARRVPQPTTGIASVQRPNSARQIRQPATGIASAQRPNSASQVRRPAAGISSAQRTDSGRQARGARRTGIACKSAKLPSARLICTDADLTALVSVLAIAVADAKNAASSPEEQKSLATEQQAWSRDRDRKCGLIAGVNHEKFQAEKKCMIDLIEARIADLQDKPDLDSTSSLPQAGHVVVITPLAQARVVGETGAAAMLVPSNLDLHFSATADAVSGTIKCSVLASQAKLEALNSTPLEGSRVVTIAIDDEVHSYRLFEDNAWSPVLNSVRTAAFAACANASNPGQQTKAASESVSATPGAVVAYSSHGLFVAYSVGKDAPWILQTNLPQARKEVKADLGIESWITPSQLLRNPYFYKDVVVGMVVQFRGMVSGNEAIFDRSGAQVFVSAVPSNLFQNGELVVLAGRVLGNKGLVSPNGSEKLLPLLDYVATFKCAGLSCEGL